MVSSRAQPHRAVLATCAREHALDTDVAESIDLAQHRAQQLLLEPVVRVEREAQPRDLVRQRERRALAGIELIRELSQRSIIAQLVVLA